jgi:peroxiredoxin
MALVAAVSPAIGAEGSNTKVGPVAESAELAKPITVGDSIPDVVVQNAEGEDVNLRKLTDGHKTAIIFYRGGWCPFCNKHLKEVASVQDEIAQAGYQVIGINADRPEDVAMAQEKKGYPFTILSDSDLTAARAFGVAFKLDDATIKKYNGYGIKLMDSKGEPRYSLPVPAFYLVNPDGKISFEFHDPDYKVRISKKDLLEAIQAN